MSKCWRGLVLLFVLTAPLRAENWPAWRGPRGDGHCAETNLPLKWTGTDNVCWKTPLPGPGNSTPIVWGERIFLTQATDKGRVRSLLCFARADGKLLWQRDTEYAEKEPTHQESNPYCSASPVTDGERVIAGLGSAGLVCYDFAGKLLWRKDLGKLHHLWGTASSPIVYGDTIIIWCGPGQRQFLLALDKKTGDKVWERVEPVRKPEDSDEPDNWLGSWATPLVVKNNKRDELILPLVGAVKAFDPKTGKELWSCGGLGGCVYSSPVYANGVVVAFSGCNGPAIGVKIGGAGDVTASHRLWQNRFKNPQHVGSPVALGERIYSIAEPGFPQCFDLQTGTEFWDQRRPIAGQTYSSLVCGDGKLYAATTGGVTLVLAAGAKYELLAKNDIGERVLASPAISEGQIFIRSHKHLWCIGPKK
jgi:outer membrane protein assembly factor BamB